MDSYLGEIKMFAGRFAPRGWALCNGQLLSIAQNEALFAVIGDEFGGDGRSTFALPDLRSRVPLHHGRSPGLSQYHIGQHGGKEFVELSKEHLPEHHHAISFLNITGKAKIKLGNGFGNNATAVNNSIARNAGAGDDTPYTTNVPGASSMHEDTIDLDDLRFSGVTDSTGKPPSQMTVENRMPYLVVTFIICIEGIFPPRM